MTRTMQRRSSKTVEEEAQAQAQAASYLNDEESAEPEDEPEEQDQYPEEDREDDNEEEDAIDPAEYARQVALDREEEILSGGVVPGHEPIAERAERRLNQMMSDYADRIRYQIGGKHYVHIYRDKPQEDNFGNVISGFLGKFQEPDIDLEWLQEHYGGGVYHVAIWGPGLNARGNVISKKLDMVYALEISGPPKLTLEDAHFQGPEGIKRFEKTMDLLERRQQAGVRAEAHQRGNGSSMPARPMMVPRQTDEAEEPEEGSVRPRGPALGWSPIHARPAGADPMADRLLNEQMKRNEEDRKRARQLEDEVRKSGSGMDKDAIQELIRQVQDGNKQALGQVRGLVDSMRAQKGPSNGEENFKLLVDVLREKDKAPRDDAEAKRLAGLLELEKQSRSELIQSHRDELGRRDQVHQNELKEIRVELDRARREAETARSSAAKDMAALLEQKEQSHRDEKAKLLDQLREERERHEREVGKFREQTERDLQAERQRTVDEARRGERDLVMERKRLEDERERALRDLKDQQDRYEQRLGALKDQHESYVRTVEHGNEGVVGALKRQIEELERKLDEARRDLDQKRDDLQTERLRVVEEKQRAATAELTAKMAANDLGNVSSTVEKVTSLAGLFGLKKVEDAAVAVAEEAGIASVIGKGFDTAREALQSKEVRDLFGAVAERLTKAQQAAQQQAQQQGNPPQTQPGGQPYFQQAWAAAQQELALQRQAQQMPAPVQRPQMMAGQPPVSNEDIELMARALAESDQRGGGAPATAPAAAMSAEQQEQAEVQARISQLIDQIEEMADQRVPVAEGAQHILRQFGLGPAEARLFLGDRSTQEVLAFFGIDPTMASLLAQDYFEEALAYIRQG